MNPVEKFRAECLDEIAAFGADRDIAAKTNEWISLANKGKYSYHFEFLGRPVIQYPQDMVAVQELIWSIKPDLIVETGIAHGGSLVMSAGMLALLDYCDAAGAAFDPRQSRRRVVGIDIDIRPHNRAAIEAHPLAHKIELIQGSSIDPAVVETVRKMASGHETVLVLLDSNHTHDHVLAELEAYAPLTSRGSYCVVFDTIIETLPSDMFQDRPWSHGDNPRTAVHEFLKRLAEEGRTASDGTPLDLVIDKTIENKLLITVAPDGYLRRR